MAKSPTHRKGKWFYGRRQKSSGAPSKRKGRKTVWATSDIDGKVVSSWPPLRQMKASGEMKKVVNG